MKLSVLLVGVVLLLWMSGANALMYAMEGDLGGVVRSWLYGVVLGVLVVVLDDLRQTAKP